MLRRILHFLTVILLFIGVLPILFFASKETDALGRICFSGFCLDRWPGAILPVPGGWSTTWFGITPDGPVFNGCSKVCGGGEQIQYCDNPAPANGGLQCLKNDGSRGLSQTRACNTQNCPAQPIVVLAAAGLEQDEGCTITPADQYGDDRIVKFHASHYKYMWLGSSAGAWDIYETTCANDECTGDISVNIGHLSSTKKVYLTIKNLQGQMARVTTSLGYNTNAWTICRPFDTYQAANDKNDWWSVSAAWKHQECSAKAESRQNDYNDITYTYACSASANFDCVDFWGYACWDTIMGKLCSGNVYARAITCRSDYPSN